MGSAKPPGYLKPRSGRVGPPWRVALCVGGKVCWFGARTEPTLKHGTRNEVIEWMWRKHDELKKGRQREVVGLPGRVRFSELLRRYRAEELPDKALTTQRCYETSLHVSGLHRTYVSSAERGERNVSFEAIARWLAAVGASWREFGEALDRQVKRG